MSDCVIMFLLLLFLTGTICSIHTSPSFVSIFFGETDSSGGGC